MIIHNLDESGDPGPPNTDCGRVYWTTSEQTEGHVSGIPADFCGAIYVITNLPGRERR